MTAQSSEAQKTPIELWIDALRSGKYKQGLGRLRRTDDSFCCLGVACELAVLNGIIGPPILAGNVTDSYSYGNYSVCTLPSGGVSVREWLGITSETSNLLVKMNDMDKRSFNEIADYLESIKGTVKGNPCSPTP